MVPLRNPRLEPKNSAVAARGGGAKSGGALPNLRRFPPKKQPFFAQNSPNKGSKQPNEGKRLLHPTCGLTFS